MSNEERNEPETQNKTAAETGEVINTPEPAATGNEKIAILKHDIFRKEGDSEAAAIELRAKNISDTAIGGVLFEADVYDIEGKNLGRIEKKILDFQPGTTRTVRLEYSGPESDNFRSYSVKVARMALTPEPVVTGNEKIKILRHNLINEFEDERKNIRYGADIAARNISDTTIASVVFEAQFFDIEGNVLDTTRHREIELGPGTSRAFGFLYTRPGGDKLKSYLIKIARMMTADVEKVQLCRNEMRTNEKGEQEVSGIVKNISRAKTDTALVAAFFDLNKENIGTIVAVLKDIEPNDVKQFLFTFKPMEGDRVASYALDIADLIS